MHTRREHFQKLTRLLLIAVLSGVLHSSTVAADEPAGKQSGWKAGLAKAVITPEKAVWLAGYGGKRVPAGKLHDLWMKALALEDDKGQRIVLVTSDFQGVPKDMSDQVFVQAQKKFGLERRQIMITFSHNHCGPRLGEDLIDYYPVEADQEKLVEEYTLAMVDRMVTMIGESLKDLAPASLATGAGTATFAVNRRNNREADVPELRTSNRLLGPVDHTVPVLRVAGADGKVRAILFGYACHPTVLNFMQWCGDYPGFAQIEVEKKHPGAMAMFVNTCGGDQNPLPRRKVEYCEKYGLMLAAGVEEGLSKPLQPISVGLKSAFSYVDLPYLAVVNRAELEEYQKNGPGSARIRWSKRLLKKLDAGEKFSPTYPYPVHACQLGREMLIIGMGAETVVDYALRFKSEFGPGTWVCGYSDDMISYIPSRRVWLEGGYEGGWSLFEYGRPAFRWGGEIEDLISGTVHKLVKQVRE